MRNILTFILSICFYCSFAQVKLSDTASNGTFSYFIGSNFKAQYPKGSCYLDRDASGSFAIRRVTGAVVTPYVSMNNYELNGETDTVLSSFIEKVNNIIMYSCASSDPTAKYIYGSPIYNQTSGAYFTDTLAGFTTSNGGIAFISDNLRFEFWNMETKSTWAEQEEYFASAFVRNAITTICDIDSLYVLDGVKNIPQNKIKSYSITKNDTAWASISTFACPDTSFRNFTTRIHNFPSFVGDNFDLKSMVVTENNDTTIIVDQINVFRNFNVDGSMKRKNGIVIDSVVFNTDSSQVSITAYPVKTYDKTFVTDGAGGFIFAKVASTENIESGIIDSCQFVPSFGSSQSCTFDITEGKNTFAVSIKNSDEQIASVIFQISKN